MLSFVLANPHPRVVYVAPEQIMIYNEHYKAIIKEMHPTALGKPAAETFGEIWPYYEDIIKDVNRTGRTFEARHATIQLTRANGCLEEGYFSYLFMPITDLAGRSVGIYNEVIETTSQVVSERRMADLLRLGEATSLSTTLQQYWQAAIASFQCRDSEVPFIAIYTRGQQLDLTQNAAVGDDELLFLEGMTSLHGEPIALPQSISLSDRSGLAIALKTAIKSAEPLLVDIEGLFQVRKPDLTTRLLSSEDPRVVVCSLQVSSLQSAAWIVVRINHLRLYDPDYQAFIKSLARQLAIGATSIVISAEERTRLEKSAERAKLEQKQSENRFMEFAKHSPVGRYL